MIGNNEYTSISLDGSSLKVSRVLVSAKQLKILRIDKFNLVDKLENAPKQAEKESEPYEEMELDDVLADEEIFGIDDDDDTGIDLSADLEDEFNFDNLDEEDELVDVDLVDEAEAPSTNELVLYNILSGISTKRIDLGLNFPPGLAIFQILRDSNFTETKKKDLKITVEDRLESIYGMHKEEDEYSYTVRDDGALLLAAVDSESPVLSLVNRAQDLYRGKIFIRDILPDEIVVTGLLRANYNFEDRQITAVVQFGSENCRVLFFRGMNLWLVSPIITEGTSSPKFLNTVFSKVLFQLDTGEVPNLDQLIIANNTLGDEALDFFKERFPDVKVENFTFDEELIDLGNLDKESVAAFTTSIGLAWASSGYKKECFPDLDFLPSYIKDRQKIFKLQWHGFLLLLLIFLSIPVANYFYIQNANRIENLQNDIQRTDQQIESLLPTINKYNEINAELAEIQDKLILLDTLNKGTIQWSTNFDIINEGIEDVNSVWITSFANSQNPSGILITGIARNRDRIPLVADLFAEATLLDVTLNEIREEQVYNFTYLIKSIVPDDSVYNPANPGLIGDIGEDDASTASQSNAGGR